MALTKVVDGGTNFTNVASLTKLLDATISSAVANYDIDSTHINSTYDTYRLEFELIAATDGTYTNLQVFVGGSVQTGSIYGTEASPTDGGTTYSNNATTGFNLQGYTVGNADGEGITGIIELKNVNSTTLPFHIMGYSVVHNSSGNHYGSAVTGSLRPANRGDVVNGLRLKFNSGNIESGRVKLYGIT